MILYYREKLVFEINGFWDFISFYSIFAGEFIDSTEEISGSIGIGAGFLECSALSIFLHKFLLIWNDNRDVGGLNFL